MDIGDIIVQKKLISIQNKRH
ncbi:MAG: hypothetical protein P8176_10150 [Gammaproteobacteria bacterium]